MATLFLLGFLGQGLVAAALATALSLLIGSPSAVRGGREGVLELDVVSLTLLVVASVHAVFAIVTAVMGVRTVQALADTVSKAGDGLDAEGTGSPQEARFAFTRVRTAALGSVLSFAVLGSTPLWFAAFGFATGAPLAVMATTLALSMVTYAGGVLQAGALARVVTAIPLRAMSEDAVPVDAVN